MTIVALEVLVKLVFCVTHERPKVEYSAVVGQFEANEPQ